MVLVVHFIQCVMMYYKNEFIYLSDMKCVPGFEGGIVMNLNKEFIGILSIPIIIKNGKNGVNSTNFSVIIPKQIIYKWVMSIFTIQNHSATTPLRKDIAIDTSNTNINNNSNYQTKQSICL